MSCVAHALSSASGRPRRQPRPCSRVPDDDAVRITKGVLLGCVLSLPLWAAIGLALRATLG